MRSKLVCCLAGALAVILVGLPAVLQTDGTVEGRILIIVTYTLGLSFALLAITSVCAGAASISRDIHDQHIILTVTKPLRKIELWVGRWLGILVVNAAALLAAGLAVLASVHMVLHSLDLPAERRNEIEMALIAGKQSILPVEEDIEAMLAQELERARTEEYLPADADTDTALDILRRRIRAAQAVVPISAAKTWVFDISRGDLPDDPSAPLMLDFELSRVHGERHLVTGVWRIRSEDGGEFEHAVVQAPSGRHGFLVPASFFGSNRPASGSLTVEVEFFNSAREDSSPAVFDHDEPVRIMIARSGFAGNLFRSLLVQFCYLALFAALGVTAGSFFSLPVAVFAAFSLTLIASASNYFASTDGSFAHSHHHGCDHNHDCEHDHGRNVFLKVSEEAARAAGRISAPFMNFNPINELASGIFIRTGRAATAVALMGLATPAVLALIGAFYLGRRELGLPAS